MLRRLPPPTTDCWPTRKSLRSAHGSLSTHGSSSSSPTPRPCSIQASLGLLQDPSSQGDAIRNAFVLLGMLALFRVLVYLVLRRKTSST